MRAEDGGRRAPLVLGAALAWALFVVLHALFSGRFWLWLLPDLLPPVAYLAVPLVMLAAVRLAGGARRWCGALAAGALVLGAGDGGLNLAALSGGGGPVPPGALRVVSWNTEYWDQGERPERFYGYLRSLRADVYLLQEYLSWENGGPRPAGDPAVLRREFPGFQVVARGELVTLSRLPVVAAPLVGPGRDLGPFAAWGEVYEASKVLRTDLRVGGSVLSVYNVHIPAQVKAGDNPFTAGFYARLRDRDSLRRAQFLGLRADLDANRGPLLVAGDFNTTAAMGDLRALPARLSDAAGAAGSLHPASWPAGGPTLWRLDWAFTAGPVVHRYRFLDPRGMSDHRAQELLVSVDPPRSRP